MNLIAIGFCGAAGVLCRFAIIRGLAGYLPFPWATFGINVLGSFVIGCAYGSLAKAGMNTPWALGATVGFLGGFTTFSAFSLETLTLLERREWGMAGAYFVLSPVLALLGAWVGATLCRSGVWGSSG